MQDLAPEGDGKPLEVHTPGQKTIEDVARFLGVSPKNKIKTLAYMAEEKDAKTGKTRTRGIVVLMRGALPGKSMVIYPCNFQPIASS